MRAWIITTKNALDLNNNDPHSGMKAFNQLIKDKDIVKKYFKYGWIRVRDNNFEFLGYSDSFLRDRIQNYINRNFEYYKNKRIFLHSWFNTVELVKEICLQDNDYKLPETIYGMW